MLKRMGQEAVTLIESPDMLMVHMTTLYSGSWLQISVHFWETVVLQFVAAAAAEEEEERFEKLRRYMGGKFPHKFIN